MIEAFREAHGQPRARAFCSSCDREPEVFACEHEPSRRKKVPTVVAGMAHKKLQNMGWVVSGGKLRCPTCEAKRKAVSMAHASQTKAAPAAQLNEPTRAQKRQIMDLLGEVYDVDAGRYLGGDTDDTVASVLDMMPGWVAQLREEFFGADGGNDDMDAALRDIRKVVEDITELLSSGRTLVELGTKKLEQAQALESQVAKIKVAVGPRGLKKAGVQA
ncbi:hypothetical protein [Shimia sagamensis]|uniref:Uncharacterized protein n=1 Tax=Shimia sagamensis TaxID=1566352 RepID=A0ABY1PHC0_9RHOB|nr:hypothetical protein [Shimia sagamensis]SMP32058.1 hypothetical protein SAMN06265373_108126 [Shimia sagamensis]